MSDQAKMSRSTYLEKNVGSFPDTAAILGRDYRKVDDLRYGTNPHQTAAWYVPIGQPTPIGDLRVLKTGKSGLSQTNLEDISYALNIVKYFDRPACAVMKHVNPSGVCVALDGDSVADVYTKARDCDPRAAFGSTMGFNCTVDADCARAIMSSFVECVVAPSVSDEALAIFADPDAAMNKQVRVLACGDLKTLPRYVGDDVAGARTLKVLADGSVVVADPLLTNLRSVADLQPARATSAKSGEIVSTVQASPQQLQDLLTAWYINVNVRSNGVVIVKDGESLAVGTGEQDRVGAVEQAIWKYKHKYEGELEIQGSVMASDGFFPFADAIETAAPEGVTAFIAPSGSIKDGAVIRRANELGVAFYHAPERIFSHH